MTDIEKWRSVPVDTMVQVRDSDNDEWVTRYFAGVVDNQGDYCYAVWTPGAFAITLTTDTAKKYWKQIKLYQ